MARALDRKAASMILRLRLIVSLNETWEARAAHVRYRSHMSKTSEGNPSRLLSLYSTSSACGSGCARFALKTTFTKGPWGLTKSGE